MLRALPPGSSPSSSETNEPSSVPDVPLWSQRAFSVPMGAAVVLGFALGVVGYGEAVAACMARVGIPLLIIGAGWGVARKRLSRAAALGWLNTKWAAQGGGFYGLVALVAFLSLELQSLVAEGGEAWTAWRAAPSVGAYDAFAAFLSSELWSIAIGILFQFSAETVVNGFQAALWPIYALKHFGFWPTVAAVAVGYAAFEAARRYGPSWIDAAPSSVEAAADTDPPLPSDATRTDSPSGSPESSAPSADPPGTG